MNEYEDNELKEELEARGWIVIHKDTEDKLKEFSTADLMAELDGRGIDIDKELEFPDDGRSHLYHHLRYMEENIDDITVAIEDMEGKFLERFEEIKKLMQR